MRREDLQQSRVEQLELMRPLLVWEDLLRVMERIRPSRFSSFLPSPNLHRTSVLDPAHWKTRHLAQWDSD